MTPDGGTDMSQWNWSPELANHRLLEEASEVLHLVKNCENSLACGRWMVTKLPMGRYWFGPIILGHDRQAY